MIKTQVEVIRDGRTVSMIFREPDVYAAMLLYDALTAQLKTGSVQIVLETTRPEPGGADG
jgi:hypothetical protein